MLVKRNLLPMLAMKVLCVEQTGDRSFNRGTDDTQSSVAYLGTSCVHSLFVMLWQSPVSRLDDNRRALTHGHAFRKHASSQYTTML